MNAEDEKKVESPAPRRAFLKQGLVGIVGLAASGALPPEALAQEGSDDSLPRITTPLKSQRVLKSESTGEPPRQQHYMETEIVGSNDVKLVTKGYFKRVDFPGGYDAVTVNVTEFYRASADSKPEGTATTTVSISGAKGEVAGDYRLDTITTTIASPLGISTDGPKQVKVLLKDPTAGMSDQEKLDWMSKRKGLA